VFEAIKNYNEQQLTFFLESINVEKEAYSGKNLKCNIKKND